MATLDTTLPNNCNEKVVDSLEQWNFDITLGGEHVTTPKTMGKTSNFFSQGVFYLFGLTMFSLMNQPPTIFFYCDFGGVIAMTRSIMRMKCIVCKNDSLLTTHLTPLVIGVPSTKPFCGKNQYK